MVIEQSKCPFDLGAVLTRFSRADVVLLGAGFSYAVTRGGAPLMGTYFDRLSPEAYPTLAAYLTEHFGDVKHGNVEEALLAIEQMRHSPSDMTIGFPDQHLWGCCLFEHELGEYTIERFRRCKIWDDTLPFLTMQLIRPTTTVLTTNYDTLADQMLSNRRGLRHLPSSPTCPHCKMRALLEKTCDCFSPSELEQSDWKGALLKLHGSIAWKRCSAIGCCHFGCVDADAHCRAFKPCDCESCGSQCNPVLVMPSASKDLQEFPGLAAIWNGACHALRAAKRLFVYGFSLPTTDCLLGIWMRRAFSHGGCLQSITILDANPSPVVERFRRLITPAMTVEITGFVCPPLDAKFPIVRRRSNERNAKPVGRRTKLKDGPK